MSQQRDMPTLIGIPAYKPDGEDPFPLTPYADIHVYTPSGARARREATPVYIPPARRLTPEEVALRRKLDDTRLLMPRPEEQPSVLEGRVQVLACLIVCAILLAGALLF